MCLLGGSVHPHQNIERSIVWKKEVFLVPIFFFSFLVAYQDFMGLLLIE